jgi:hypothetical protein
VINHGVMISGGNQYGPVAGGRHFEQNVTPAAGAGEPGTGAPPLQQEAG